MAVRRRASRVVVALVGVYLLIGVAFAVMVSGGQVWQCPDPVAPHGYRTGNVKTSEQCEPTVSLGDRLLTGATLTVLWLPLVVGKASAG